MSKLKTQNYHLKASQKRILVLAFSFMLLALSFTRRASAQNVVGLAAIPPRIENLLANPGETIIKQVKLQNQGETEMAVKTQTIDFIVQDDQGVPVFLKEGEVVDNRWTLSSWISISPTQFIVQPGETKVMDLIIIVPEDASPGGHYAAITYQSVGNLGDQQGSESKIIPSVATLVYLTVAGEIKEEAVVKRMDIPKFSEYGPIDIATEIENLSDVHIKPVGTIRIYNLFRKLATSLALVEQNIFPGRSRIYQNNWQRKWLFGRYQAKLEAGFGSQGQALLAVAYFWVIPWKLILIILLVITLVIMTIVYFRKKRRLEIKQPETQE